jgi:hypothetical protein
VTKPPTPEDDQARQDQPCQGKRTRLWNGLEIRRDRANDNSIREFTNLAGNRADAVEGDEIGEIGIKKAREVR